MLVAGVVILAAMPFNTTSTLGQSRQRVGGSLESHASASSFRGAHSAWDLDHHSLEIYW